MPETLDPISDRACRMTYAYKTGIELRETLRDGACLRAAVIGVTLSTKHLEDGYPDWHPAPDSFDGMLRLFIYREITGDSYRTLETYQELADHVPSPGTGMQPALVGRIQSRQGRAGGPALPTRSSSTVKPTSGRPRGRLPRPTGSISATERRRRKIGLDGRSPSTVGRPRLLVSLAGQPLC